MINENNQTDCSWCYRSQIKKEIKNLEKNPNLENNEILLNKYNLLKNEIKNLQNPLEDIACDNYNVRYCKKHQLLHYLSLILFFLPW